MKKRNWITVNCSMIFLFQDFFFFPFLSYQRKVKKVPRRKMDYLQNYGNNKTGKNTEEGRNSRELNLGPYPLPSWKAAQDPIVPLIDQHGMPLDSSPFLFFDHYSDLLTKICPQTNRICKFATQIEVYSFCLPLPKTYHKTINSVSIQFSPNNMQPWWLTCVYGPQGDDNKLLFMQELRCVRSTCQGPWTVLGDFNLITSAEDKNNGNLNRAMMGRFRRLINELKLKELPLQGRKFITWSNQQDTPTLVKLDRVFYSAEWEQLFPNAKQCI